MSVPPLLVPESRAPAAAESTFTPFPVQPTRTGTPSRAATVPLIAFCHLSWDGVWQRPQQFLSRLAKHRPVLFVETYCSPVPRAETRTRNPAEHPNVTVLECHLPEARWPDGGFIDLERRRIVREFLEQTDRFDAPILWFYDPMAVTAFAGHLGEQGIVYDCMDELSQFAGAPAQLVERERELLGRADVVFCGGRKMREKRLPLNPNCHFFGTGVDCERFGRARRADLAVHPDIAALPGKVLGYFGVIDERIDYDLLAALADALPQCSIVMVGPTAKVDPAGFPQRPNLHWLGRRPYEQLPAITKGFSVCLMPFARNAATEYINPTKALEYMAAGRPVVSTDLAEVRSNFANVCRIARTNAEFIDLCRREAAQPSEARIRRGVALAAENTWESIVARLETHLVALVESREDRTVADLPPAVQARKSPCFDYLIVGAGFAGSVVAERLARVMNKRVLLVDRRSHIGGNAYDCHDEHGILIHRYGPHIFHTNSAEIFAYLSNFTEWRQYQHRVRACVDGRLVPIPINLDTVNELYGLRLDPEGMKQYLRSVSEPRAAIVTSEDVVISSVGRELYEKFFRNYTRKQWGLDPSELDAQVTARVPVRYSRDDRYFTDRFQAMPARGFTHMFGNMLDHPNIKLLLNCDYREIQDELPGAVTVYTGQIDQYFDYRFGELPYRCLNFRHETHHRPVFQPAPVVNYPNEYDYTRITEFKYLTGQEHSSTSIVYEFPTAEGDPYYPIPRPANAALYKKYQELAALTPNVHFVGRLGTYRYYNMDQVVGQALTLFARLSGVAKSAKLAVA